MSRIRTVKPEFWQHPKTGTVSRDARLLFLGLLNEADDEGRMRYSPKRLAGVLFPFDEDVTSAELGIWISELSQATLVDVYTVDGADYLAVPGFTEHQRINRPSKSILPVKPPGGLTEPSLNPPRAVTEVSRGEVEVEQGMEGEGELIAPIPARNGKRDELWESMLVVCGISGAISPSARGAYNRARADLAACGATPIEVQERAAIYRMRWPSASLTPTALARRWSECEVTPEHLPGRKLTPAETTLLRMQ